jgi:hypothetical protein
LDSSLVEQRRKQEREGEGREEERQVCRAGRKRGREGGRRIRGRVGRTAMWMVGHQVLF